MQAGHHKQQGEYAFTLAGQACVDVLALFCLACFCIHSNSRTSCVVVGGLCGGSYLAHWLHVVFFWGPARALSHLLFWCAWLAPRQRAAIQLIISNWSFMAFDFVYGCCCVRGWLFAVWVLGLAILMFSNLPLCSCVFSISALLHDCTPTFNLFRYGCATSIKCRCLGLA